MLYVIAWSVHRYASKGSLSNPAEVCRLSMDIYRSSSESGRYETECAAALSIDVITVLLDHDEIDLLSFWSHMTTSWSHSSDPRPKVIVAVLDCLSRSMEYEPTVSQMDGGSGMYTARYLKYIDEVFHWIWRLIPNDSPTVQAAAFRTLSSFKLKYFTKDNVPTELQQTVTHSTIYNDQTDEHLINQSMFLSLINLAGSEPFLQSIICHEIESLPRNTAHNAIKKQRNMRQNVETNDRINQITKMIRSQLSQRRIAPDLRSKLCVVQLCIPSVDTEALVGKNLRALLVDCPFDQNNPRQTMLILNGWKSYIRCRFETLVESTSALEAWKLFYKELTEASRGSPTSQVHAVFALSALITCLWNHRRMHGAVDDLEEIVESGIETIASVGIPDRTLHGQRYRLLDWSHYKADSQTGRMSTSQLAKGAAFLALCQLQNIILELNYTVLIETIIDRNIALWRRLEDCEPLEAFAIGATGVKFSTLSHDLAMNVERVLDGTEKDDVNLSSIELMQVEGILSRLTPKSNTLEQLNRNKLLRHRKMFYRIELHENS